jgi:NADH:ubiquinone reductase (H+-translocating)
MTENIATTNVVVIGGGYAGTLAANHLLTRAGIDVTLVNPRPTFVERIRLHQLVAGSGSATVDYGRLLNPRIRLVVDEATEIDADARMIRLASGDELPYDYVIYAVGSTCATADVPGAAQFALPIGEFEKAERLRCWLADLREDAPVCVVGGGLTGIETAAELAQERSSVTLISGPMLGPSLSPQGRRSVARQLNRLGVRVLEDCRVAEVRAHSVVLADGSELPSAATVWTAGFGVPALAARSGLHTDELGRLLTDETLTSVDDVRIVAAGDAAAPSGLPLRMSCQAALPLGAQAANTVRSRIAGTEPAAVSQAFVGQCISLGRFGATFQIARSDDTPVGFYIGGRIAARIKEFICRGTVHHLEKEARKPGSYFWLRGGKRAERLAEAVGVR